MSYHYGPSHGERSGHNPGTYSNVSPVQPTCFRISGIPPDWDGRMLKWALLMIDRELNFERDELSGPFPAPYGAKHVALLSMECATAYFHSFRHNEERREVIDENGRRVRLVFDKHFYDLTPMNMPASRIRADVIAVTGLAGHAFGSWRSRIRTNRPLCRPMWLRDFLPQHVPGLRVMTYGYDSSLVNPNNSSLADYRSNFMECLQLSRRDCPRRPLILLGHSLGGILIAQALIESSKYPEYHDIFDSIRGAFFFGTPHQGLRTIELEDMAGDLEEGDGQRKVMNLLAQLREGSDYLCQQRYNLAAMWRRFHGRVLTFYETERTRSVRRIAPGVFERGGAGVKMVNRLSAHLSLPGEVSYPIATDHTDLVKFSSAQYRVFQTVADAIHECAAA